MPLSRATRIDRLSARPDVVGSGCDASSDVWYRPRQLLVHRNDRDRLAAGLRELGAEPYPVDEKQSRSVERDVPVDRYLLPQTVSVPAAVAYVRARSPRARLSPNHLLGAAPNHAFGPGDEPRATDERRKLPEHVGEGPIVVGVLDTGVVLDQAVNPHLASHQQLALAPSDDDPVDTEPADGMLDDADAHGIFIADLIRAEAPEVVVRVARVLIGGVADEVEVAAGIVRLVRDAGCHIVNLSLGGYTLDDQEPIALAATIAQLDPRPVLVAAAGNDTRRRPFWPAALPQVVGVGAVDARGYRGRPRPARFTNRGPWVDACAQGVDVLSTFVAFDEREPDPLHEPVTDPSPVPQRFDGWALWSGTSFASPLVAARIAAAALQRHAGGQDPFDAAHGAVDDVLNASGTGVADLGVFVA